MDVRQRWHFAGQKLDERWTKSRFHLKKKPLNLPSTLEGLLKTTVCTQEKCFEARPFAREDIWSFECIHVTIPLKARGGTLDATPTPTLQGTLPHQISSQAPSWN
jgi:hypothetical protein